jgi:hypothetical protein
MSKLFNRALAFHVEGEVDDKFVSPESVIKNYEWSFEYNEDGNIQIFGYHKDNKGRITNMTRLPKIYKWKSSDKELLLDK